MNHYQEYSDKDIGEVRMNKLTEKKTIKEISLGLPAWKTKYSDMCIEYCEKNGSPKNSCDRLMAKVQGFLLAGGEIIEEKKEPIRDFVAAIAWFERNWNWSTDSIYPGYINPNNELQCMTTMTIRQIVINRVPALAMWPDELME
jgi:hypothetical protein